MKIKSINQSFVAVAFFMSCFVGVAAQSLKVNLTFWLSGSLSGSFGHVLTRQLALGGEALRASCLLKQHEEVVVFNQREE